MNTLDKESSAFAYLAEKFPSLNQAKVKEGVFIGPQIRKIVFDKTFITHLKRKEKLAFESFKKVYDNFLGNHRSKDHALFSFGLFAENLGDVSDEHGERFHHNISVMEQRFKEKWSPGMLADYCWGIKRQDHTPQKRLRRTKVV